MALTKSERLEIQAAAATNVRRRIEEAKLREKQKQDMADFTRETEAKYIADAEARKEEARERVEKNLKKTAAVKEPSKKESK